MRRLAQFATTAVLAAAALGALGGVAGALHDQAPPKVSATTTSTTTIAPISPPGAKQAHPYSSYNQYDSGMWNSQIQLFNKSGQLVLYGDNYVTYYLPPQSQITLGKTLYQANCSVCHGVDANGIPAGNAPGSYPDLVGLGPATYDFWIISGRMPAYDTRATEEPRRPAKLSQSEALAIAAYLNTFRPATPYIPVVHLQGANLAEGAELFALNCAACHTITGDGDALANDTFAPSLRDIPAYQVAEALRIGPANMPVFTGNLSDEQLRDVVAYVVHNIQHPVDPGGLGLGGLGPVGEGFIGLALGVGLLAVAGFWVGDRSS